MPAFIDWVSYVSRRRGNRDQASNDTGAESHSRPLVLQAIIEKTPSDTTDGRRDVGDDNGHDSAEVGGAGTTTVETEPSNPEENCSQDDMCNVVGTIVELMSAVSATLTEHERVGKGSASGSNMNGGSSGEIESSHNSRPARRVPCPAGDRVVDYGGPHKHENDTRE